MAGPRCADCGGVAGLVFVISPHCCGNPGRMVLMAEYVQEKGAPEWEQTVDDCPNDRVRISIDKEADCKPRTVCVPNCSKTAPKVSRVWSRASLVKHRFLALIQPYQFIQRLFQIDTEIENLQHDVIKVQKDPSLINLAVGEIGASKF